MYTGEEQAKMREGRNEALSAQREKVRILCPPPPPVSHGDGFSRNGIFGVFCVGRGRHRRQSRSNILSFAVSWLTRGFVRDLLSVPDRLGSGIVKDRMSLKCVRVEPTSALGCFDMLNNPVRSNVAILFIPHLTSKTIVTR